MTAISTDNSNGRIWDIQIEELPLSSHGTTVTVAPARLALVHGNVDTVFKSDTLDLNTYVNGTVNKIRGIVYAQAAETELTTASTTWSGTSLTMVGHGAADHTSAVYKFGAIVELKGTT